MNDENPGTRKPGDRRDVSFSSQTTVTTGTDFHSALRDNGDDLWSGAPFLAFEKWPAENRNRALWRQHRGPLLKKREKWRPQLVSPNDQRQPELDSAL